MRNITAGLILLVILFCNPLMADHPNGSIYVDINGLVCDFCARALEKVFAKKEQVESISVDLDSKVVTIHFNNDQSLGDIEIIKYINDAGYSVEDIRHDS